MTENPFFAASDQDEKLFSGGYRGGRGGGYDRGDRGGRGGQYQRDDNDERRGGGGGGGGGYGGRDQPGSHPNFGMRRDRRESDRRPPPPQDFKEPTEGELLSIEK